MEQLPPPQQPMHVALPLEHTLHTAELEESQRSPPDKEIVIPLYGGIHTALLVLLGPVPAIYLALVLVNLGRWIEVGWGNTISLVWPLLILLPSWPGSTLLPILVFSFALFHSE